MNNLISVVTQSSSSKLYIVTHSNGMVLFVPADVNNADYQRVQQWIAAGGTVQMI